MMVPILSWVAALYSLQNCMMLTPLAPRAGPTGGAGFALPAAKASHGTGLQVQALSSKATAGSLQEGVSKSGPLRSAALLYPAN